MGSAQDVDQQGQPHALNAVGAGLLQGPLSMGVMPRLCRPCWRPLGVVWKLKSVRMGERHSGWQTAGSWGWGRTGGGPGNKVLNEFHSPNGDWGEISTCELALFGLRNSDGNSLPSLS